MTGCHYRTVLGAIILIALYLQLEGLLLALVVMLALEGLTDLRLPVMMNRLRGKMAEPLAEDPMLAPLDLQPRFEIQAERVWRLLVGAMLAVSLLVSDSAALWLLPWFMGFAIFGAGLSTVCPILMAIKWAGFR